MVTDLEGQRESLVEECVELSYFMRGAISYEDMMSLSPTERGSVGKFLNRRMEIEGKRRNPVY